MAANKRFDVFLSHNSKDKAWVIKLKDSLEAQGIKVWLDKDEIRPGDLFAKALEHGIKESKALALVISPESMTSGWVEEEYYRALGLTVDDDQQLIPVLYRNAEIPGFLQTRNWVDFRDETKYEESVQKLIWGITGEKTLPTPTSKAAFKPVESKPRVPAGEKKAHDGKPHPAPIKTQPKKNHPHPLKKPEKTPLQGITQFLVGALTLMVLIWVVQFGISLELIVVPAGLIKWVSASSNPKLALWTVSIAISSALVILINLGLVEGLLKKLANRYRKLFAHLFGLSLWVTGPIMMLSLVSLFFLGPVCHSPTAIIQIKYPNNQVQIYDNTPIHVAPNSNLTLTASSDDSNLISCSWTSSGSVIDSLEQRSVCTTKVHISKETGRGIINLTLSKSSCSVVSTTPLQVIVEP